MRILLTVLVCCGMAAGVYAELLPVDSSSFFAAPGQPLRLKFKGAAKHSPVSAVLTDFAGKREGEYVLASSGKEYVLELKQGLPAGFYRLETGEGEFGLLIQEPSGGEPDRFFGIDGFLSWSKASIHDCYAALKLLKRYGIASARDRFEWNAIQRDRRVYSFRNPYDEMRRLYPRTGVELLDVHHGSPEWARPNLPRFPEELHAAAAFWATLGANWRPYWKAVEIWNEPEGGFGANLPADQLMPGAKAMRYGLLHSAPEVKLGAAGFTSVDPAGEYHRTAVRNGMLDNADFVSFHSYGEPRELVKLVESYRNWLEAAGKTGMPLWLTEISRVAWDNYRTPEEAARIAAEIAMQAAVGRSVGLERIYFFALFDLKEGNKTFGFLAPNRTARAPFAALVQSVRRLSHRRYRGELRTGDSRIASARVFGGKDGDVTVLEVKQPGGVFSPGFAVRKAEGTDGRALPVAAGGSVELADRVVYLESAPLPETLLNVDTAEMQLLKLAELPAPERSPASPVVLFPHPDFAAIGRYSSMRNYAIAAETPVPVALDLYNLSGVPQPVTLTVSTPLKLTGQETERKITVPALGKVRLPFKVELSREQERAGGVYDLDFELKFENEAFRERASLSFHPLGAVRSLAAGRKTSRLIPFGGLENWTIRIKDQPWNNRADLDAGFRLSYAPEALKLELEVEDDRHHADFAAPDLWKGDSVQIGIQPGMPKTLAERAKFFEFTVALTPKGAAATRGSRPSKIPAEVIRSGTRTLYRITLPAAELGVKEFRAGDRLRLSLVVNDNDGAGRKGFLHWGDGLGVNKNPEEFNQIVLQ